MISRRALLAGAAAATTTGVLPALTGCTRGRGRRLEVAVVWSGGELDRFREVLDAYPGRVDVTSAGDEIDAFLRARHRAGNSPDIAVLSRPGLLPTYVDEGWLVAIPETPALRRRFPDPWRDLLRVDGALYGVWVKATHKSLFWQQPSEPFDAPASWSGLVAQVERLAAASRRDDGPAPLAIGAADGWVLTDWLENLLAARTDCELYHALSRGRPRWSEPEVARSFGDLYDMWSVPGAFPGGPSRALLTQNEESVVQVFAAGTALAMFEGDFVTAVIERFATDDDRKPGFFRFPSPTGRRDDRPLVVGGDAAVLLSDTDDARELLGWLTDADTFAPWLRAGGFLAPNVLAHEAEHYHDDVQRLLAQELLTAGDDLRFDLSDLLAGPLGGGEGQGSWRILQDFFADATRPGAERDEVVAAVTRRLDDAARSSADTRGIDPRACG